MKSTMQPNGTQISDYLDEGNAYDWVFNHDTDKKCIICGFKIINQKQINGACTGICDYRDICSNPKNHDSEQEEK